MKCEITEERLDAVLDWHGLILRELYFGQSLSPEDAEDIGQEVAIAILTRASIDPAKMNKSFVRRLVKGIAIDFYRHNSREPSAVHAAVTFEEEHEPLISEDYIESNWGEGLAEISAFLTPERFRVVYLLAEGYTYPETAAALGLTVNRVKALQAQVRVRAEPLRIHLAAINAII